MAKIIVDQGLADTIKSIRVQNGVQAKNLAAELGKSRSYISKLESGGIASIEIEDLVKCLQFISKEKELNEIVDRVFKTVSVQYSQSEINNMLWVDNFDKVYRQIPIPEEFSHNYQQILQDNNISVDLLVKEINKNVFIPEEVKKRTDLPVEQWFNVNGSTYIKMHVSVEEIQSIILGKSGISNYVTLLAIVLYTLILTDFRGINVDDEQQSDDVRTRAEEILKYYKIYTLFEKQKIMEKAASDQEMLDHLSKHDRENMQVISEFNPLLSLYSSYDVISANRLIAEFTKNMEWDAPLIMEIAGLPFYKLENSSFRLKKELLEKIRSLLDDTVKLPEAERKRERY